MGFFGGSDKITHHEFKRALFHLKEKGFSESQIEQVESVFRGDLDEEGSGSGISKDELKNGVEWLKEHPDNHHLDSHQIETVEQILKKYL